MKTEQVLSFSTALSWDERVCIHYIIISHYVNGTSTRFTLNKLVKMGVIESLTVVCLGSSDPLRGTALPRKK